MKETGERFEVFPDPCNNWIVWDALEENFAEVGTHYMKCMPENTARAFSILLNKIFPKQRSLLCFDADKDER
jgi:hypothetical protein